MEDFKLILDGLYRISYKNEKSTDIINEIAKKVEDISYTVSYTHLNKLAKETYKLLEESSINFKGNIEARDLFTGKTNIVIADRCV